MAGKKVSSHRPQLTVEKRKLRGHQLKKLRREGWLPANLYGKKIKSLMVQVQYQAIKKFFDQYGETNLIDLQIEGEKKPRPVLMKNPQYNPVDDSLLHLDFYQVNLAEKVSAKIPLAFRGEAPAVEHGQGVLVPVMQEIEVEALPTDLPEEISVDISHLEKVGDEILVKDLEINRQKITPQAGPEQVVVKIEAVAKEEEKETAPSVEGEESAPAEGEGEKKEEGEKSQKEGETAQESAKPKE